MRKLLLILTFALALNSLHACLYATQNRLFPIGACSLGLCVMESHLERTEYRNADGELFEFTPSWGGITYFKIYDENHKVVHSEIIEKLPLFEEKNFLKELSRSFNKAHKIASGYTGFIVAKPLAISFCDYQKMCSKAEFRFNKAMEKVEIRLTNNISYPVSVLFDTTSIAANLLTYFLAYDKNFIDVESFEKQLYLNSVRQYQIATKYLTVVHIGAGQSFELADGSTYPPGKEYAAKFPFNRIERSVYQENVLHHGHGFDFFIWE